MKVRHLLMGLVGILTAAVGYGETLEVAGSTTVEKSILEPVAKQLQEATGVAISVRGVNTGRGFEELKEGKIKASIASAPLSSILAKAGLPNDGTYQEHVLRVDVIAPIVHKENPVNELTWEQLSDLNTGKVTNWKDVGGADQAVVVVTSQSTAATRMMFQEMVMKKADYASGIREVKSTREEVDLVSKFKGGIGAVSVSFLSLNPDKVKVVKSKEINRPLSFITKGAPDPVVQKVLDYLKTDAAQKMFR
ncbi:MAG: solute-binding protein [Magnetococcales bacterium]|nr:substrate-binding domain-containing protein [Magnetococcales bacterium]NGZ28592.1 solute-binding protein [Magnetococcales bacterium]